MTKTTIVKSSVSNFLSEQYENIVNTFSSKCCETANEYLNRYGSPEKAVKKYKSHQIKACVTSGFLDDFGVTYGKLTKITIPTDLANSLVIQIISIATIATMGGFCPTDEEVRTFAFNCLPRHVIIKSLKTVFVKLSNKMAKIGINHVRGSDLTKVNRVLGGRVVTKNGSTGVINLISLVPIAGVTAGAVTDFIDAKNVIDSAYREFIKK